MLCIHSIHSVSNCLMSLWLISFSSYAGDGDGFEQVFGPDDKPIPGPEEQRLPYPDESPGFHRKEEPHQHRQHQRSSRRRKLHKHSSGGLPASSKGTIACLKEKKKNSVLR